ncbi:MAG: hypothetical protein SVR81_10935, partial [Chloroflexota bacterium]|nr:hypothetical protein [Chloroflexota bacterium]
MNLILTIIRGLIAIVAPAAALALTVLTILRLRKAAGIAPEKSQVCLRCGSTGPGDEGVFHYTESVGNPRERAAANQINPAETPILGSETHFVCDQCARRFAWNELVQGVLLVLPYPLYLYVIIPIFAKGGIYANFLIETLLVVLSIAGAMTVFDLNRASLKGPTPLADARDHVAINERKSALGKKFSYYTRFGASHLRG